MRHSIGHIATEQEYFHRLDAERIEEMRQQAAWEEQRRRMAEAAGINDSAILEAVQNLGYTPGTIALLRLAPLVQVAWADGSVSAAARKRIVSLAVRREITQGTPAYRQLTAWLDQRPSQTFFEGSLRALQAVLNSLAPTERDAGKNDLLRSCWDVALAFAEPFRWRGRLSVAKRKLLAGVEAVLSPEERAAACAAATHSPHPST